MQRKITKAERRLLITSVGAIALLGGVALFRVSINAEPQVVIPPYPTAPNPNGFDVYVKAATMIVAANPAVDRINDSNAPTGEKAQAQKYSLQKKERWLKRNAAGFSMFQRALRHKYVSPNMRKSHDYNFMREKVYPDLRQLARNKVIQIHAFEMRKNWGAANEARLDVVQMGADVAHGNLVQMLIGVSIQKLGFDGVRLGVEHLKLSQCRESIGRLTNIYQRREHFTAVLNEEKYGVQTQLLEMMRDSKWRTGKNWGGRDDWEWWLRTAFVSKKQVIDNIASRYDVEIKNAKQSYKSRRLPAFPVTDIFNELMWVDFKHSRTTMARNDAANAMWLVALALHAHKLEHKSFPTELRVLEGKYLKAIPADPFGGGEPLRFKRDGESYVLWSVGPDKSDNGGKAISYEKNASPEQRQKPARVNPESRGDYVWGKNQ